MKKMHDRCFLLLSTPFVKEIEINPAYLPITPACDVAPTFDKSESISALQWLCCIYMHICLPLTSPKECIQVSLSM